jgi:deoxycytidylate deaminase
VSVKELRPFVDILRVLFATDDPPAAPREREYLPELVIAFTKPQGADNSDVVRTVGEKLTVHGWSVQVIEITKLLANFATFVSETTPPTEEGEAPPIPRLFDPSREGYEKTLQLMQWGDDLRRTMTSWEMARFAVAAISVERADIQAKSFQMERKGVAYLIKNLMHPTEVSFLRSIYKQRFFLFATHQAEDERLQNLVEDFSKHPGEGREPADEAEMLIRIDSGDRPASIPQAFPWDYGVTANSLNINDTFHRADAFVGYNEFEATVGRWSQQVFGYPWGTPTVDEYGMSVAYAASKMSASLGRPVGAAIVAGDSVLANGWNDIAQPFGGLSRFGSDPSLQEHNLVPPVDSSDENRIETVHELLNRLFDPIWDDVYDQDGPQDGVKLLPAQKELYDWLKAMRDASRAHQKPITKEMVNVMASLRPLLSSRVFSLIEYGRSVHAEMAAITDAARRGCAVHGATMYITTFPCHECARNIVAAGIRRVVFVEPYGKSLAETLYKDAIQNRAHTAVIDERKVTFEPFTGLSPSRFDELFSSVRRKYGLKEATEAQEGDARVGQRINWDAGSAELRPSLKGYLEDTLLEETYLFEKSRRLAEDAAAKSLRRHLQKAFPQAVRELKTKAG